MIKKVLLLIVENWGEIGAFLASVFIAIKYGIKFYKWCKSWTDRIKEFVDRANETAKQLEFNGGHSVKDIVSNTNSSVLVLAKTFNHYKGKQDILIRNIITPIYECDTNGILISVNRSWENLTGLDSEDALGEGWKRIIHEDDIERVEKEGTAFIRAGLNFNGDFKIVNQETKETIEVHCSSSKIFDSGICISIVGTLIKK